MTERTTRKPSWTAPRLFRVGAVSYLNARPLLWGLDRWADLQLLLDVPSRLGSLLERGDIDVALLPVIDYQQLAGMRVIPAGGIGCDGPTLTVRIFSRVPIPQISALACDVDSHTSVALARVILAEQYGLQPELVPFAAGKPTHCSAQLLIGDKVVCSEPAGHPYQLDLGQAWKELTGLPFVFAVWMSREGIDLRDLPDRLLAAKQAGVRQFRHIAEREAPLRGWPVSVAYRYLSEYLRFDIGPRQIEAMCRFLALAGRHGLFSGAVPPVRLYHGAIKPQPVA